ncbi:hypothetical protein ACWDXV_32545 [Nocardia nova]
MNSSNTLTRIAEIVDPVLRTVLEALPVIDSCYATGSIVAGLGTSTSDIDLVMLVADARAKASFLEELPGPLCSPLIDIEVYTFSELEGFIELCSHYSVPPDRASRLYRVGPPLKVLSQLSSGCEVIKDSAVFAAYRSRITELRPMLRRLGLARAAVFGANTQEDLLGFLVDEDAVGSFRRSHDLLEFGLDALCIARNQIYPDERMKWLWRRLQSCGLADAELSMLERQYVPEAHRNDDTLPWRRLDTFQGLLAEAMLACWLTVPGVAPVPIVDYTATKRVWRSPRWRLFRSDDAWLLASADRMLTVPVTAAFVWARASSMTRSRLIDHVVEATAATGISLRRGTVARVLHSMEEMGTLIHGDFRDHREGFG